MASPIRRTPHRQTVRCAGSRVWFADLLWCVGPAARCRVTEGPSRLSGAVVSDGCAVRVRRCSHRASRREVRHSQIWAEGHPHACRTAVVASRAAPRG